MPRQLPTDDVDLDEDADPEWIQFRGAQTSVTHDATGVRFSTERRHGRVAHKPLPVVDDDIDPSTAPDDAVLRSVAEDLVESNPLIAFGVACEVCGDIFPTPKSANSHHAVHTGGDGDGGSDTTDGSE